MNPPLRTPTDREALRRAVIEGDLEAFATDHAPHPADRKAQGFLKAPFGIVGLETAVGVTYTELVQPGHMSLATFVQRWTTAPSRILGLPTPGLNVGDLATMALLDITSPWQVVPEQFASRSRNTPFKGRTLVGRAVLTVCEGSETWREPVPGQPVDTDQGA
jgi:dihydroorotase